MPEAFDLDGNLRLEKDDLLYRARHGLLNFTCYTKPDYEINWHHRVVCRYLNQFVRGDIRRLIITMPPRHGKSELVSRRMPALLLGMNPDLEIISASYSASLARRMNRDVQRIIMSPQYFELFPDSQLNARNIRTVATGHWLRNSEMFEVVGHRGYYLCAGIGGALTGSGGDIALIDDPIKSWAEARSPVYRERSWEWYTSVLYTRLSKNAGIVITLTRWNEDDLAGRIMGLMGKDGNDMWTVVNLPAINEEGPNEYDPREVGEALWQDRFPLPRLQKIRSNSEQVFTSLYQGRPAPLEGNIVKRAWWQRYRTLPDDISKVVLSIDLPFKDKNNSDLAAFQVWGCRGADRYLLHSVCDRMAFNKQVETLLRLKAGWPHSTPKLVGLLNEVLVEDAANGAAIMDHLGSVVQGLIPMSPSKMGSKEVRAQATAPAIESGNYYLPDDAVATFSVDHYINEWATFPNGANDDQVDATTQMHLRTRASFDFGSIDIFSQTKGSQWAM